MKVFVTKYLFTKGIQEIEGDVSTSFPSMFTRKGSFCEHYHGKGKEWHSTREQAIARAEYLKLKKVAAIEKQLAKIKALTFE